MYEPLIFIHSWTRWIVVIAGVYALFKCYAGWFKNSEWGAEENHLFWAFSQVFAYQVMFGIALYLGVSPIIKSGLKNFSSSIQDPLFSYWMIYHGLSMLVALAIYFYGRKVALKKRDSKLKFQTMAITLTVSFSIVFAAMPWPFLNYGRALFRGFSF